MTSYRLNSVDQALDICGSLSQSGTYTISDEPLFLGSPIAGQAGTTATISAASGGISTLTGLSGFTSSSVGSFITITGAASVGNNGTFQITNYNSTSSVDISNAIGTFPDANSGSLVWTERLSYSLEEDLNYERSDRQLIKGVAYYSPIPTYQRPTAIGTNVPANLSNIASKTTDAQGFIVDRAFYNLPVSTGNTYITLSSTGLLKHSDAVDKTGIPCFDAAPFTSNYRACYVNLTDGYNGNKIIVQAGLHIGEQVFGITRNGSSTSPNSVEVAFYSVPLGDDITTQSTPYTWEASQPTTSLHVFYGYYQRLDQLPEDTFRNVQVLGISSDGYLVQNINNILSTIGTTQTSTSLNGLLTNIGANYPFYNLPNATPTVVQAFNTLNAQIGDRTYTGGTLTSGQTIAASLQVLANQLVTATTRTIERISVQIPALTSHTLPGGLTYTQDGTNNGRHLWVYVRKQLQDPGSIAAGDDYEESSSSTITFFYKINAGDHINYFKL